MKIHGGQEVFAFFQRILVYDGAMGKTAKERAGKPLLVGNWKMNGLAASRAEVVALLDGLGGGAACEMCLCPPATLLACFAAEFGSERIAWGAQDCHAKAAGAHTGDVSAEMLADAGAEIVIIGHSERRRDHGESDEMVRAKAEAAHRAGLVAIVCIGESEEQRQSGDALEVLEAQLRHSLPAGAHGGNSVIAYEPIWAIGSGRVPSAEAIVEAHGRIRSILDGRDGRGRADAGAMRILYGGSLAPDNAGWLLRLEHVDGGLIGGASLKADSLLAIAAACR